jgi:outer membrane cobalamin receptor
MKLALVLLSAALLAQSAVGNPQSTIALTGFVVDETGAGLPRAKLEFRHRDGRVMASTQTNTTGEFAVSLPEGTYIVDAMLGGFAPLRGLVIDVTPSPPPLMLTLRIPGVEQQIVVTATRTAAAVPQVGASLTVLTREQLARDGIATVAEALRKIAGLSLVQSGGQGQLTSAFVRGGESDYTKVLLDGIPLNDPGGSYNFANLSATGIDRMEIVRGPQSALFGSDAIAGVIQIFTHRAREDGISPTPRLLLEGGTFSSFRYAAGVSGRGERFDYSTAFSRTDTDNDVLNGSFNEATFTVNTGFIPSPKTALRAIFRSEAGRAGVPGPWAFRRPEPDEYFARRDLSGGLEFTHLAAISWTQKLSYTVNDSRQFSEDPADSGSFVSEFEGRRAPFVSIDSPFQFLNHTNRQKINYQSDIVMRRGHLLTAGADYERESGSIGDPQSLTEAVRNNFGFFAQDQWAAQNRFFAAAGVRLENNDSFGFFAAPRLSLAFHAHQPSPGSALGLTKIKGNFGLGIKEPTLVESFSQSPFFRGNPDLKPEKSVSFDAGIEQHFGQGSSLLELTYFDNRFRDQVGFVTTDFTTFEGSFFNIGKTRARGVEGTLRLDLSPRWEAGGAYTFLNSRVLESTSPDPVFAPGQELFRRPRHSGYVDLRWKPGSWTLGATAILVGRRVDSDFSGLGLTSNPGYGVLNLLLSYRLSDSISWFALVNNALDKEYMEALGFPALRAHFRIGLRAGF